MLAFIAALWIGGGWVWLVLVISSLGTGILDELVGNQAEQPPHAAGKFCDLALYATLPLLAVMTLYYLHYVTGNDPLGMFHALPQIGLTLGAPWVAGWLAVTGATLGTSYFYALAGMTVAHELLHRTDSPAAQVVSRALLAFTLSGHYTTYHLYGHHRNVGTFKDPATARRDEYVLAFVFRCILGEFREALRIERARLRRKGLAFVSWHNRIFLGELFPWSPLPSWR
jgi:alkane 1-monooxygenase